MTTTSLMALPQGDVRLLRSEVAQRLLGTAGMPPAGLSRVGVIDFATRFPGGSTAEQFAQRGR